jgi:dTDP-4-amino-4,6-dideoxygalactose transaminase
MDRKIWLSSPHMGGKEQKYIQEAFESNWIAPLGENVTEFENLIANYTGGKYVTALSSGTAAIHLALILLGVSAGDEVIASSFTFSATINPIVYQGALPILVDSERETWNMSPKFLELAILDRIAKTNKKPKAIIVVHLYGMPAKIDEILEIADHYEIPVIEDAAEALGSTFQGKSLGTFGIMGVYSFNGNKIITTSGGGALISSYKELIDRSRFLSTQARDNAPYYQHSSIGYNYRMSNVLAGIGRGQMEVIDKRVKQHREINKFYRSNLEHVEGIKFQTELNADFYSNFWLTALTIDPKRTNGIDNEMIRLALEKENIESRFLWKPMHLQPVFSHCPFYGEGISEKLFNRGICLPSGSNLTEDDRERIIKVLSKIFNRIKVLDHK